MNWTIPAPVKRLLPRSLIRGLVRATRRPRVGGVDFGGLRRTHPISRDWGFDRGTPVDRYYIHAFLEEHAAGIRGRVLEVADNTYTLRFGGDRVERSEILHDKPGHPKATVVADLAAAGAVPDESFDAIICTQTLHLIYDIEQAVHHLHRMLKPGGVLLATLPGVSQISREDMARSGDYWRVTTAAVERLFAQAFPDSEVEVRTYGNVLAAIALLHGVAAEELSPEELDVLDDAYQVTLGVRAVRGGSIDT